MGSFSLRSYVRSQRASTVEFALVCPLLVQILFGTLDVCNLLADRRQVARIAESIVRAAHAMDQKIAFAGIQPLSDDTLQLLRNIAERMKVQLPGANNAVWIGRYVRPQPNSTLYSEPVQQLLPNGMWATSNEGVMLRGDANNVAAINSSVASAIEPIALPGEIFYAVEIRFTRHFFFPLPENMRRYEFSVRFVQ